MRAHPHATLIPTLATAMLGAPLFAQRAAEVEPNDTVAQAQTVALGTHVEANLAAGEQDWFAFTLAAPTQVHARTSGNFAVSPSVDTYVAIYDAAGANRLAWDDNSDGNHSDCGVTLPAGAYTVLVMGKATTTTGAYGMDLIALPALPINVNEGAEPNNNPGSGGTPTPFTPGDTIAGELTTTADVDWWSFTLGTRSIVQAVCMDDGGAPQLDNTRLAFFQGSALSWSTFGTASFILTSHRAFNLAHPGMLAPGSYAIEVSSATSTAAGTAPWNYTKTGKYALRTRAIPMPGLNVITETPEPNSTPATAAFLTLGDSATGNATGSLDGDWYGFVVGPGTTVAAMCETPAAGGVAGTTLRLYNADGVLVTTAGGQSTTHARLITTLAVGGIYYLEVAGAVLASTGNYVLNTGSADAMFVPSSFTQQPASTNACPGSNGNRPIMASASGERPALGSNFVLRVERALANTIVVPVFGFSNTLANGAVPLPFDLTALGAPGCFIRVDPAISFGLVTDAAGLAFLDLAFPADPAVRGTTFYGQALCFDPSLAGNTLQLTVSNDSRIVVGDRTF
jgi:hypothetical protein